MMWVWLALALREADYILFLHAAAALRELAFDATCGTCQVAKQTA